MSAPVEPPAEKPKSVANDASMDLVGSKRSVGIQTQYRDSEAQTDPYTPDYQLVEGEEPEVLAIAHMKHGTLQICPEGVGSCADSWL